MNHTSYGIDGLYSPLLVLVLLVLQVYIYNTVNQPANFSTNTRGTIEEERSNNLCGAKLDKIVINKVTNIRDTPRKQTESNTTAKPMNHERDAE
jgi:hypothetical protein